LRILEKDSELRVIFLLHISFNMVVQKRLYLIGSAKCQ